MPIFQGLAAQGLGINTDKTYSSVAPGLKLWVDSRERVTLSAGNTVSGWGDKSNENNDLFRATLAGRPYLEFNTQSPAKQTWIMSNDQSRYLVSPRRDYTFLHNGSRFGIYCITKLTWSLDVPTGLFGPVSFSNSAGTGLQGNLTSASNNGRWSYILRGGALVSVTRSITNLLAPTTGNPNYTPSGTINIQSFVNIGANLKMTYGNASSLLSPFYTNPADYPQGQHLNFQAVSAISGQTLRVGIILIYDWTGKTDAEVLNYDTQIRELLEIDKAKFQLLDV